MSENKDRDEALGSEQVNPAAQDVPAESTEGVATPAATEEVPADLAGADNEAAGSADAVVDDSDDVLTDGDVDDDTDEDDESDTDAATADGLAADSEPQAGSITVNLLELGQGERPYQVPEGSTVSALLEAARLSAKLGTVLVDARHADLDTVLTAGTTVVFATKVRGGRR